MLKKAEFTVILAIFIALLLAADSVGAENTPNTFINLVDVVSKEPLQEVFVKVEINEEVSNFFLEGDNQLKLSLPPGTYHLNILVNDPNTESYDYYGESTISVGETTSKTIHAYPVGSVSGFVKDKIDNTIAGANLKFECNNIFPVNFPEKTDKYGSFSMNAVPVGRCKIQSSFAEGVGTKEVEIRKGERAEAEIQLDNILVAPKKKSFMENVLIYSLLVLLIAVIVFFWSREVKGKKKIREIKNERLEIRTKEVEVDTKLGQRGRDILKTLRANEKKIIDFLLEHKRPIHLSKIHYKTGISKGSLFRNLKSLEEKNIIKTTREGKVRKVSLSKWFMGE